MLFLPPAPDWPDLAGGGEFDEFSATAYRLPRRHKLLRGDIHGIG
jgi:hypothetical protein